MRHIAFAATLVAGALVPFATGQTRDHLACFAIKDSAPRVKYQATLTTAAGAQTCIVRTPAKFACVPTSKNDVTPAPPGGGPVGSSEGAFLCYRAKCPKTFASSNVEDQFGTRVVQIRASRFLCAPAAVSAPPPGLPASTTTTLPGDQNPCDFRDGKCRGTCGNGQTCGAAVGTASCECRETSCGDADTPECAGACSNAGEACVFSFTGCSCVRVP